MGSGKKNLTWDNEMDTCLLELLIDQMSLGQKMGSSFSNIAYCQVAQGVSDRFGLACSSEHVKNRIKTLKKNYKIAAATLSVSGFSYNKWTHMIEAEAETWENYLSDNPDYKGLRHKPVRNYHKLAILFGKEDASGSLAASPKERNLDTGALDTQDWNDDQDPVALAVALIKSNQGKNTDQEPPNNEVSSTSGASISRTPKKRKSLEWVCEELKRIRTGMDAITATLEKGNHQNHTEANLFSELLKIRGLSDVSLMKVYTNLATNSGLARAFFGVPAQQRALWLKVEFGQTIFDTRLGF